MNKLEFPEPPVGPEVLRTEFLQGVQPSIDVMVGAPKWLLTSVVIGALRPEEEISVSELTERVHSLLTPEASELVGQKSRWFTKQAYERFQSAGMITLREHNLRGLAAIRRTQKAKDNLALAGAFIASQLVDGLSLGTTLSRVYRPAIDRRAQGPYPFAPTRRLRIAQLIEAPHNDASFMDVSLVMQERRTVVDSVIDRMRDDGVLKRQFQGAQRNRYQLNEAIRQPVLRLLGAIASIQNPEYADYARALSDQAMKLLDPEHGKELSTSLIKGWESPLPKADEWIDTLVRKYYEGEEAQRKAKDRIQWLLQAGLVTITETGSDKPFELHAALQTRLTLPEQRFLAISYGVGPLLFRNGATVTRHELAAAMRRSNTADPTTYLREHLVPKALEIVRTIETPES
ncbi:MAG TPA: hypothetical protein VLE73_06590 [Candidatus Saccharimonadales bacterium]|nr:hypothetical protein [Candidatus Saccharimonadales bacterium]